MINGTNEDTNQKWVFTHPMIFAEMHNNPRVSQYERYQSMKNSFEGILFQYFLIGGRTTVLHVHYIFYPTFHNLFCMMFFIFNI